MVVGSFSNESVWSVNIDRLWKARIIDAHNLLPKLLPDIISHVEVSEEDAGVGATIKFNFTEAVTEFKFVKHKIVALDSDSYKIKDVAVDGGFIGWKLKTYSFDHKLEAVGEHSTLLKLTVEYETLDETPFGVEEQNQIIERLNGTTKAIEGFLHANPTAYV